MIQKLPEAARASMPAVSTQWDQLHVGRFVQVVSSREQPSILWCGKIACTASIFGEQHYQVELTHLGIVAWFPRAALRTVVPDLSISSLTAHSPGDLEHDKSRHVRVGKVPDELLPYSRKVSPQADENVGKTRISRYKVSLAVTRVSGYVCQLLSQMRKTIFWRTG